MSSLPRIDQIEDLLKKEWEEGSITKNLDKDFTEELAEMKLLKRLISGRVEKFVFAAISAEYNFEQKSHQENQENQEKIKSEILDKIAHAWFESQVDRYYLERKESFERVSFQMFRTKSKGIALEAHQRLTEGEESWKEITDRWGAESEKENEGKYFQLRPSNINKEICIALRRLKKGEISEPVRNGNLIAILKLLNWTSIELDQELRVTLEKEMYVNWLSDKVQDMSDRLS